MSCLYTYKFHIQVPGISRIQNTNDACDIFYCQLASWILIWLGRFLAAEMLNDENFIVKNDKSTTGKSVKTMIEWTREKTLILIEEYKKRPGLWDMTHEDYRKKDVKKDLLDQVAAAFDGYYPPVEIEKKFHTLRTQYHREINRMSQLRGTEPYKSKWFAFTHLEFLSSPNACRSGRSTTVKVKIEKADSNTSTVEEEEEPAAKYVIKSIPVHTYTTTIPTHTIQAEFLTTTGHNDTAKLEVESQLSNNRTTAAKVKEVRRITRKELETLIEDATKNVEEQSEPERVIIKEMNVPIHNYNQATITEHRVIQTGANSFEAQPQTEDNDDNQQITDNGSIQAGGIEDSGYNQTYQSIQNPMKVTNTIMKRSCSPQQNKHHRDQMYEEVMYDEQQAPQPVKKLFLEKIPVRDEFTIFGEYVANELRFITNRDILVTAKHKINVALFEACTSQLSRIE